MSDGMVQVRVRSLVWLATAVVLSVVCTLLATRAWSVDAAPGDDDSTFVPTPGCRLADTRPAPFTVGLRAAPLGAGDVHEVTVRGSNGECSGALTIPSDAVAVALNVTATNATAASDIRLYPANLTSVPTLSNLNVTAGAPPTPNKVDVKLSPDGKIRVFNFAGSVNVILDVVGYYTNSTLQELSQRVVALEVAEAANTPQIAQLDAARPFAVTARDASATVGQLSWARVVEVEVTAPVAGQVTVISTTNASDPDAGDGVRCSITTGTATDSAYLQQWESGGVGGGDTGQLAGTRTFDIAAGATTTYRLVCLKFGLFDGATVEDSVLTAIFTPAP